MLTEQTMSGQRRATLGGVDCDARSDLVPL